MILRVDYTRAMRKPDIASSYLKPSDPWPGVSRMILGSPGYLFADPGSGMTMGTHGVMSGPAVPIDWNLQLSFTWYRTGDGMTMGSEGAFAPYLSANTSDMIMASAGVFLEAAVVAGCVSNMTMGTGSVSSISDGVGGGSFYLDVAKSNWIGWSDVGSLDFTVTRKNVAGTMPMDWSGYVYGIKKLGSKIVVLGANGVSIVTPSGNMMGLQTIHKLGLIGRDAFAGNNSVLYFIDALGCLYQLTDTLKQLDYREYLLSVTTPTLTFDESTKLLYICNGTKGYVYSQDTESFGAGPVNITGSGYKNGVLYLTAPAAIATPVFEICTDIYDFGTRNIKTIYNLDFGTDVSTGVLQAAVEYRRHYDGAFTSTTWKNIKQSGKVKIVCSGGEFKFKLKLTTYKSLELDYFNVNYTVHAH